MDIQDTSSNQVKKASILFSFLLILSLLGFYMLRPFYVAWPKYTGWQDFGAQLGIIVLVPFILVVSYFAALLVKLIVDLIKPTTQLKKNGLQIIFSVVVVVVIILALWYLVPDYLVDEFTSFPA